jgi:GT2 family glycosyltransferase
MIEVSLIVPNYNGERLLAGNLPAVFEAAAAYDAEVIVVDDGSTDNSVKVVEEGFPEVRLVVKEKNEGFASAVNAGAAAAAGRVIVLLNTDVRPEPEFLSFLLPHFDDGSVFAVGCLDKSVEGGKVVERGRGAGKLARGFLVHRWADPRRGETTLWVAGGSGAFDREKWAALGGMRTIYNPFYYEDIDLSWRARKRGWRVLFEARAVVVHEHEEGPIRKLYPPEKVKAIAYRNQFLFVWLNASDSRFLLEHLVWLPWHFLRALRRRDWPFWRGFLQALVRLGRVWEERKRFSGGVVPDAKIVARQT